MTNIKQLIMMLVALFAMTTGAWADDYTITLPTISNGSVVAKVNDASVTSAAAGATVSLVATPDAGYRLKTISATYNISETFSSGAHTRTGTYFRVSGSNYTYGWRIGSGDHYTLTISSLSNQNLSQVVLTVGNAANVSQRNKSHLQADHGTLSATGTTQGNTITITDISSPTVTVSAPSSGNAASMWTITQAKVDDGLGAITLTDTSDDNVKTFTMPSGNVTVSAEFEELTEWPLTPDADKKVWTLTNMPANNIELQVEYEPTKVTMAANDKTMGTVEVSGESKVEWTADTWKNWTSSNKVCTVDDITVTSTESASVNEWTNEDKYLHSLFFYVSRTDENSTVTFSTTGDPFSRIEFTMIDDYAEDKYIENKGWLGNPVITPKDGWTFEGKSAVWEGEATKSLTLQSCTTWVSKITFFKGAVPDGVTVNDDGTFTVAKTATVTLTATPKEGYKFLYWEDDQTNTNPVREVTIEPGMADKTYKAVFAEITYNVSFADGIEDADKWKAEPNAAAKNTEVKVTYSGTKKVLGVKAEKKAAVEGHALSASAVGEIVGTDGKAYAVADKDNLPEGVTAVSMVAYKSGSNGLAIQLNSNPVQENWADAKTYAEGLTAVPGGTWRLPSKADWQNMFVGCAVSGDASASDNMNPIAGFKAKIAATGITWKSGGYWSSTESGSKAWYVYVDLGGSLASAYFYEYNASTELRVLACLAF